MNLDVPEKAVERDIEANAPVVVADVTPAAPVQVQPASSAPIDYVAPPVEGGEPQDIPDENVVPEDVKETENGVSKDESVSQGLVTELQGKLEKRNVELEDMKSMLAILEERGDDPERIELYKQLVSKTEKEILDLQNDIVRYNNVSKG
jgi:AAA ATPase containing von Willebrand factor type A (vWA) domain